MRYSALCVLLLAISESLLIHAKVVVVVPVQKTRRSPAPWRSHYKKSSYGGNDFRQPQYNNRYYNKKPFRPPYPSESDDFNQGYEAENHVYVPYGKDISHSVTFGKPYIPYNTKGSNSPFGHERYAGSYTRQPNYPPTDMASVGQEYAASASSHYESPHTDSFFSDMDSDARNGGLHDNNANKYYTTRSIEKDLSLRNQQALSNIISEKELAKGTETLVKDIPSTAYTQVTTSTAGTQGAVILPAGIPSATIAGNKNGIVLRDTVSLDEYQKKLEELTKNWPSVLSDAMPNFAAATGISPHQQQLQTGFSTAGLPGSTGFGGPTSWFSSFAQPKQSYAVREEHGDSSTYDFRTMPINVAYQQPSFGTNLGLPIGAGITSSIHG
ncbi:uncharacterized protein LOC112639449 [Camponotus floridanus]|uniref:uncharacterized protein LOC112639449 n=1 Tax=Camponotus floridanus TaxID=104421 RepID=UPI000DC698BC|nr:uncharacterized protein LOC112639449 [Camponotus floridanus]